MTPWAHQEGGVREVLERIEDGFTSVVLSSPTGMGKTWMVAELVSRRLALGERALLYTGRRLMLEQLQRDMAERGLSFGVRAAGVVPTHYEPFQIASIHTDKRRSQLDDYADFPADLVVVDEGHLHTSPGDQRVLRRHRERGAVVVYVTATPIGMGGCCDVLVQAGTNGEGRRCGALVRARHFGPDEPALNSMQQKSLAHVFTEGESKKAIMRPGIFGRVLDWFKKLNKQHRPTILFAPGVPEGRWFAQEFFRAGVTSASIDGEEVWINGEQVDPQEGREEVRRGSEDGSISVVCNRFVLREGANWPWLSHGIFATVFDSLQSYLQAGGRLLRSHPSLRTVSVQDHGGNWWRHGSLNEDRHWQLDGTAKAYAVAAEETYRDGEEAPQEAREPLCCPQCFAVLRKPPCAECGFAFPERQRVRIVVQEDGTLLPVTGKIFKKRRTVLRNDTRELWKKTYWRMRNAPKPKSFRQLLAFFKREYGYEPPRDIPYMPLNRMDWTKSLKKLPLSRLVPDPTHVPKEPKPRVPARAPEKGLFDNG